MLLRNREVRIKLEKTKKNKDDEDSFTVDEVFNPTTVALVEETGKRWLKYLATTVIITVAAIKVVDVLGDIAVKKTASADNEE